MNSASHFGETLERILEEEAKQLARETGFIQRGERQINGADFVQGLILGLLAELKEQLYLVYTPAYDPMPIGTPVALAGRATRGHASASAGRFRAPALRCQGSFSDTGPDFRRRAMSSRQSVCARQGYDSAINSCRIINLEAFR
jgi:hypothetical protein